MFGSSANSQFTCLLFFACRLAASRQAQKVQKAVIYKYEPLTQFKLILDILFTFVTF